VSERTWSLRLNGDGTATARFGDTTRTVPVGRDEQGRGYVHVALAPIDGPTGHRPIKGNDTATSK